MCGKAMENLKSSKKSKGSIMYSQRLAMHGGFFDVVHIGGWGLK